MPRGEGGDPLAMYVA